MLEKNLAQIIAGLQSSSDSLATALRSVVLIGVGLAAALAALVGYLSLARGKQAAAAAAARQQTEDILRTVREGLFLLDADLKIGEIHSDATGSLFQRESIAGITFEDLLRNLVSAKTLAIATKFVKVLWSERTKENLIRSINPLNEVEVITGGDGKQDKGETRYLEFNFHRVRRDGAITHVLVSVADVTARVALAAQLKGAQDNAQTQMDAFLSILHVDPNQLSSFLDDSDVAFKMINATLRDPARDSASFRRKIDGLFRQIHSIKGEASAIGLGSMEQRAHALESDLAALRERTDLTGDDFLPLLTKFDDLVSHSQSVREMVTKLASFRDSFGAAQKHAPAAGGGAAHVSTGDTTTRGKTLDRRRGGRGSHSAAFGSRGLRRLRAAARRSHRQRPWQEGRGDLPRSRPGARDLSPPGQGRADPAHSQCRGAWHRNAGRAPGPGQVARRPHPHPVRDAENGSRLPHAVRGRRSRPDARQAAQDGGDEGHHFPEGRRRAVRPGSDDAGLPFRLLHCLGCHP